eukprot:1650151-Prymnesium_polylepis.2
MKAEWDRAGCCAGGHSQVASTHACRTVVCVKLPFHAHGTLHSVGERGPAPATRPRSGTGDGAGRTRRLARECPSCET